MLHVLLIEDEPSLRRAMIRRLGEEYDVTGVGDGFAALAALERGERYDAILCDMKLPDLSGIALHDAVQKEWPEQARRFVFVSGGVSSKENAEIEARGRELLEKPSSMPSMRAVIDRVTASSEKKTEPAPARSAKRQRTFRPSTQPPCSASKKSHVRTSAVPPPARSGSRSTQGPGAYSVVDPEARRTRKG